MEFQDKNTQINFEMISKSLTGDCLSKTKSIVETYLV